MLEAEFVRDLHKHYIVLKGIEGKATAYGTRMLLNNQIPGLLNTELRCIDQTDLFYYDITSKKSLTAFCENKSLNHSELKNILAGMLNVIENSGDYLLLENDFIIDPNYIFINGDSLEIGFCHLPGNQEQIQEQLSRLMEYLMNKVDYKDEAAVVLIYAMYKATKEPDCTFEALLKELEKKTEPRVKKITVDTKLSADNSKPPLIWENDKPSDGDAALIKRQEPLPGNPSDRRQEKRNCVGTNGTAPYSGKQKNHKPKQQSQLQKKKNNKLPSKQIQGKINPETAVKQNARLYSGKFQTLYKVIVMNCFGKETQTDRNPVKSILREEVISEREYQYFRPATFILAGLSVITGIVVLITALYLKLLHNAFGTHIDGTKLFSCILIISCLEVYIFIKLFDSKNKITGIRTEEEDIEAEDSDMEYEVIKAEALAVPKLNEIDPSDGATQLLWMDKADSSQEATVILSRLSPQKLYRMTTTDRELTQEVLVRDFPFYIGKLRKGVDLTIDDKSVSRRHARLTKAGEDIFLTDLNSTNGTYLNNVKMQENKPYLLTDKDEISFSQINYTWNVDVE